MKHLFVRRCPRLGSIPWIALGAALLGFVSTASAQPTNTVTIVEGQEVPNAVIDILTAPGGSATANAAGGATVSVLEGGALPFSLSTPGVMTFNFDGGATPLDPNSPGDSLVITTRANATNPGLTSFLTGAYSDSLDTFTDLTETLTFPDGNSLLTVNFTGGPEASGLPGEPVLEPASAMLLATALLGVAGARRKGWPGRRTL